MRWVMRAAVLVWAVAAGSARGADMPATRPADAGQQQAIRIYPSALLPPVAQPYYFLQFIGYMPRQQGMTINSGGSECTPEAGHLHLDWFYGPQNPYLKTADAFVQYYTDKAASGAMGVQVDEWQSVGGEIAAYAVEGSIAGIKAAKKLRPEFFVAVYWRGEETIKPLLEAGLPDLLIIEGYSHLNKKYSRDWAMTFPQGAQGRIRQAREMGVLDRTIFMLGMFEKTEDYPPDKVYTLAKIEKEIQLIRNEAPEMPGIGIYNSDNMELAKAADRLIWKYFVEPAPQVAVKEPKFNQLVEAGPVTVRVEAKARRGDAPMREYRWFVDHRWMQRTTEPVWTWEAGEESLGMHILTVHAIDQNWNRSAVQTAVFVTRHNRGD